MFNAFYCGQGLWDSTSWLERTGSDQVGINKMKNKANIIPIFVEHLSCPGANALKQEILSIGGEAAVHKYTINCKRDYTDVLILATPQQYKLLIPKLRPQYWRLKDLSQDLKILLANINKIVSKVMVLREEDLSNLKILRPTLDLVSDLRELPIVSLEENPTIINLAIEKLWQEDVFLIREYNLALQSKGYQVAIKITREEQHLLAPFLQVNYLLAEGKL